MGLPAGVAGIIRTDTQQYPYTAQDWRADFGCMVPRDISAGTLQGYPLAFVMSTSAPAYDPATQKLEHTAVDNAGTYEQSWSVVALDADELEKVAREADESALKVDADVLQLFNARPGPIDTYVANQLGDLTTAQQRANLVEQQQIQSRAISVIAKKLGLV